MAENNFEKELEEKKGLRTFGLTTLAVDNAISVFLLTAMILLFGISSYINMPKESFPEVPWPKIYINTVYFGNSPADMESLVTREIEKELADISELKSVTSQSLQDYSLITAEFEADVEREEAIRKVKDAVDKAKPELPNDLTQEPEVLDVNLAELPILTVNVSGNYNNDELRSYAEYLQDRIEELSEISSVDLKGAREREVKIDVDLPTMTSLKISFGDIESAIASENINMSGGEIVKNDFRRTIRIVGEFENVREMESVIVKSENQRPIFLKDIAKVVYDYEDPTSIARSDGLPVISLDVIKRSGENLLDASDKIKALVQKAKEETLPENLKVSIFNDQSVQTRDTVNNLENSIILGVILVVIVLMFFLGIRNASFVGLAIPLSMLMGILIINLLGYSLNMVVLFSLILALGLLVDNAIVVVENIYRYLQNGYTKHDASRYGASEVALPIIASTATTLAAFLPLAFWPGLMGEFMKYLPITLIIVLSSSLFVALVINPVFTQAFMQLSEREDDPAVRSRKFKNTMIGMAVLLLLAVPAHFAEVNWLRNILVISAVLGLLNYFILRPAAFFFQERFLPALESIYDKFIRFALRGPMALVVFIGTIFLLIGTMMLLGSNPPKVVFFPDVDPLYVNAFIELPLGTDIETTDKLMRDVEEKVDETIEPYTGIVEAVLSQIGENTSDPNGEPEFGASPQKARLTVSFVPSTERGNISTWDVMDEIRQNLKGFPGVKIIVDKNSDGPPTGKPINLELRGDEIDRLATLSEEVIGYINAQGIGGIEELKASVNIGKPELAVNINREAARRYGVSTFQIADVIRTAVFGKEVSQFKDGEDEYPIQLRIDEKYRNNINDILNQSVTFRSPSNGQLVQVPISAVADISYASTYNSINRKDQKRMIAIYSNVLEGYNANEVVDEVKNAMFKFPMPNEFSYEFTGEQEEQAENMAFLSSAFIIALFTIFIIIVTQFNSLISPFIIILSVLFSTIGVFLGYYTTQMDFVVIMSGIGIISLAGIVVNNAIVLIDYITLLIRRKVREKNVAGMQYLEKNEVKEAIVQGGSTRLRPVLLTAITTILGLIPLAIGLNINFFTLIAELDPNYFIGGDSVDFWGVMAWTVIYGLFFATFLTLIVVPAMFWLAFELNMFVRRLIGQRPHTVSREELLDA